MKTLSQINEAVEYLIGYTGAGDTDRDRYICRRLVRISNAIIKKIEANNNTDGNEVKRHWTEEMLQAGGYVIQEETGNKHKDKYRKE